MYYSVNIRQHLLYTTFIHQMMEKTVNKPIE